MSITVSSAFDSGNITLVKAEGNLLDLEIKQDAHSDFYQWFYFRVVGAEDRPLTLRIVNCAASAYPHGWQDYRACMSYDREDWERVDTDYQEHPRDVVTATSETCCDRVITRTHSQIRGNHFAVSSGTEERISPATRISSS